MAAVVAAQLATMPIRLYADCQSVIGAVRQWMVSKTWGSKMHDGFLRFMATQSLAAPFEQIAKVKAHRSLATATSEVDLKEVTANGEVDVLAKAALMATS